MLYCPAGIRLHRRWHTKKESQNLVAGVNLPSVMTNCHLML